MPIRAAFISAGLLAGQAAWAQAPMSAIDWLSDSLTNPEPVAVLPREPGVTGSGATQVITVTPLDAPSLDSVGLLPVSVTGLPKDLWGNTQSAELADALARFDTDLLPALREQLMTLLLAELDPPADADGTARLFLARIDTLLGMGAVEQALALLDRAGPDSPALFRRWFDASLLTGTEETACAGLRGNPDLSPTLPARVFCLARGGDWNAAALTLDTGRALGELDKGQEALLARFLDLEGFDDAAALQLPQRPSPLDFRLYEAIGEALPTTNLPVAFAYADLGPNNGWKAQIIAAERLARSGAISANQLLGLYTERRPAASGGVWDRVASVQRFDQALNSGDADAVSSALPGVWNAMTSQSLELIFARLYARPLQKLDLSGPATALAFRIGLLGPDYETVAASYDAQSAEEVFLAGLARGNLSEVTVPGTVAQAIFDGFTASAPPPHLARLIASDELGAAILQAIAMASDAAQGDLDKLAGALALFRAVGLEETARRTGLQMLLLDRRG